MFSISLMFFLLFRYAISFLLQPNICAFMFSSLFSSFGLWFLIKLQLVNFHFFPFNRFFVIIFRCFSQIPIGSKLVIYEIFFFLRLFQINFWFEVNFQLPLCFLLHPRCMAMVLWFNGYKLFPLCYINSSNIFD
jgi:hypothetical protein